MFGRVELHHQGRRNVQDLGKQVDNLLPLRDDLEGHLQGRGCFPRRREPAFHPVCTVRRSDCSRGPAPAWNRNAGTECKRTCRGSSNMDPDWPGRDVNLCPLMFSADALKNHRNPAFQFKMVCLSSALVSTSRRTARRSALLLPRFSRNWQTQFPFPYGLAWWRVEE